MQLHEIVELLCSLFGTGFLGWGVKQLAVYLDHKKNERIVTAESLHETDRLLRNGVVAMLHHELYDNCTQYIRNGYVTPGQLNDLEYIFCSYKDLGGNGTGEILYNKVKKLDVKDD